MSKAFRAAILVMACASSAFGAEPSTYELELWKSASSLNVADSYADYLSKFPSGVFATQARLAIAKVSAAASPKETATTQGLGQWTPASTAAATERESGATNLMNGARLMGPGVVTVGRFGAKRQIVIPEGEWIVLAAYDHKLTTFQALDLTTLAFARAENRLIGSLVVVTTNTRTPPPHSGNHTLLATIPRWPGVAACEVQSESDLFYAVSGTGLNRHCAAVRQLTTQADLLAPWPGLRGRVVGAPTPGGIELPAFARKTEFHVSEFSGSFLSYTRFDVAAEAMGKSLGQQTSGFGSLMQQAYQRNIDQDDLQPLGAGTRP